MFIINKDIFSERLKQSRKALKLTQKQLANKIGINERTYQRLEAGDTFPSSKTMIAIMGIFGQDSFNYIMGELDC